MGNKLEAFEQQYMKTELPQYEIGDTVKVHHKIVEGEKERTQIFQGVVIAQRGVGLNRMFTVRKVSFSIGVEKTFPVHSPRVEKVQVIKKSKIRRAKLYYLRKVSGKSARLKEKSMSAR